MSFALGAASAVPVLQFRTGGKDVLASGTVFTGDNKSIDFTLGPVKFAMEFSSNSSVAGPNLVASVVGNTLVLKLTNFDSALGSGTPEPMEVGTFGGRKLYLAFMVYAMSPAAIKTIDYTFFQGDSV